VAGGDGGIMVVDPKVEEEQIASLNAWRAARDQEAVDAALAKLEEDARSGANIMPSSIEAAKIGVTTGEWGAVMRKVFGEYRAPTGVGKAAATGDAADLEPLRARANELATKLGRRVKFLVGKPGLDGHSNGAEQIAVRARDCGMEVVYEGIRLTPAQIVNAALEEAVHVVGLSILSGSHVPLVKDVMTRMKNASLEHVPVIVGGIIPDEDAVVLKEFGVARVYTPKDFRLNAIMSDIFDLLDVDHTQAA
jgi:methylmalonyl-CoA mutase C-terminal domain